MKTIFTSDNWSLSEKVINTSFLNVEQRIEFIDELKALLGVDGIDFDALESKMIRIVEVPFSEIILPVDNKDEDDINKIQISTANLELTHTIEFGKNSLNMYIKMRDVNDAFIIIDDPNEYEFVILKYPVL